MVLCLVGLKDKQHKITQNNLLVFLHILCPFKGTLLITINNIRVRQHLNDVFYINLKNSYFLKGFPCDTNQASGVTLPGKKIQTYHSMMRINVAFR